MVKTELQEIMNMWYLAYPNAFKNLENPNRREMYEAMWFEQLKDFTKGDVIIAINDLVGGFDGYGDPKMKDLVSSAKMIKRDRLRKLGMREYVLDPPERVASDYFHEIMARPNKTDADFKEAEIYRPFAEIYSSEENFKHYFRTDLTIKEWESRYE